MITFWLAVEIKLTNETTTYMSNFRVPKLRKRPPYYILLFQLLAEVKYLQN